MFLQLLLLSSCRDFTAKSLGTAELEMRNAGENANICTFNRKYPCDCDVGKYHPIVEQLYRQKLRLFQWLWCFTEPLSCWLYKIYIIWCLWILGKQRLRGKSVWWLWFVKLLPSTQHKPPGFTLPTFSSGSQTLIYQIKPWTLWVISFPPASRTIFFITLMLQRVLTAFCRCLCQYKSFFFTGTIPYSGLKSCREILTSCLKLVLPAYSLWGNLNLYKNESETLLWKKRGKVGGLEERKVQIIFYFLWLEANPIHLWQHLMPRRFQPHFHLHSCVDKSICLLFFQAWSDWKDL